MDRAHDMVRWLTTDAHRTAKEIAAFCDVKECTVSRWLNQGVDDPDQKHLDRLRAYVAWVEKEMILASPTRLPASRFKYVCSRAESYPASGRDEAHVHLSRALDELRRGEVKHADRKAISVVIIPWPLEPIVDAHLFVAQPDESAPMAAVVLYRSDLGPEALRAALITEINHLVGHAEPSPVRLSARKNFIAELGRKK